VGERVDQQGPADHRPAGRGAYHHDRVGADFRPDRRDARPPCHLNFQAFCSPPAAVGPVTLSADSVYSSNMRVTRANCNTSKPPNLVVRGYAVDAADAA
jgi:hypothetical protein